MCSFYNLKLKKKKERKIKYEILKLKLKKKRINTIFFMYCWAQIQQFHAKNHIC